METIVKFPNLTNTLQLIGCHFGVKPPSWEFPTHHHHFFELIYCGEGEITHRINGVPVRHREGDWLLINLGSRHSTLNDSQYHYVYFNAHFDLDDMEMRKELGSSPYRTISREEAASSKLPGYIKAIEQLLQRGLLKDPITDMSGEKEIDSSLIDRIYLQSHILLILAEILFFPQTPMSGAPAPNISNYMADIAHAIEERLARDMNTDISITDISSEFHLSRYQCSKIFSQVYGLSPRQYLSRLKLSRAKEMLVKTNMTVDAIAESLGFSSVSHFSRQFRRWTNQAPSHFRPKHFTPEAERALRSPLHP
ncbi:AraC family transcriptional regulator [Paenibacillus sp. LHD-117]|uniref:AraC family transcriptional regulator n=1 Tax=Paenibacillus sp. LHD-117 TaxID=3071412 RepID=UPI0027DF3E50|nr:AraC family transcriptional regulator [Paenibacillus sp. LHD-117]MDQ6423502.1 AraC family transcriptional regulator [Paenibacillus sp. LHD-117]